MRQVFLTIGLLLCSLASFAGGTGGGGGGERPGVPMSYNPAELGEQENQRRLYCLKFPRRCELDFPRGQCGDVYSTLEQARKECSPETDVRQVWRTTSWSCTCYELVREGQN